MTIFGFPVRAGHIKKDTEKWRPMPGNETRKRLALGVGTVAVLSFLLSMHLLPDKVSLQVGDISTAEIRSHRTVRYIDSVETERQREDAAARTEKQYKVVLQASYDATEAVRNAFDTVRRARVDSSLATLRAKSQFVHHNLGIDLSDSSLNTLISMDDRTFDRARAYSMSVVKEIMDRGEIRDDTNEARDAREQFRSRVTNFLGNAKHAQAVIEIVNSGNIITPNRLYDPDATRKARELAKESVTVQYRQLFPGDVLIEPGQKVTPEHIDKFLALGLRHPGVDFVLMLCITVLVASVTTFIVIYTARYHHHVYASTKLLLLLSLIVVVSVLGLKLGGSMLQLKLSGTQFGYFAMIWMSTAGMLTAALINPQLAVVVVSVLASTSGLAMNHELRWALSALLSSLVAIYAVSDIRHRSDLVPASVAVCAGNLATIWLVGRISGDAFRDLLDGSGWAVFGGIASIMLFWFGTTALEKPFGITTHNRLVELSDTNNPMLKRLLMEAPGTYSHSIFVGNIAATAADVIGADALLVRVASYYHDIGKIKRPHFFVENQHVENIHDHLNPSLSALVIRSHIKDGLELAREYKLPPLISELMLQHHGTSLVRYFYHQATSESTTGSAMLEQQFRYDGSKPKTKEAALLMLADAVEAASRALSKPTPGQIENMVDGIIAEKLADGQMDESELTFKDISRLRESFLRTLTSMMHARIEYPELPPEARKLLGNGSPNKEQAVEDGRPEKAGKGGMEVPAG